MKKLLRLVVLFLIVGTVQSQNVAITDDNGYTADPSAMLDVKSTTKGILVPRLTTVQRTSISSPANGLLVFDSDEGNFYFYNGSTWLSLTSESNGIWNESASKVFLSNSTNKVGIGTSNPFGKLEVQGDIPVNSEEPLFEVVNSNGDTVFAVYSQGVRVYVDDNPGAKALNSKGGFAVGGYSQAKGGMTNEYLRVTPDSVRIYIDDNGGQKAVGSKGGFAIGGFSQAKATNPIDYFNISGADSSEIINPSQARLVWYPQQEAFLAGKVLIEDVDSVGLNSFATGYESKAVGDYSQAMGYQSITRGNYSFSLGREAVAGNIGDSLCFALGYQVEASSSNSFAMGMGAKATSTYSFAFGQGARATGLGATAFGTIANATGHYSYASGYVTTASGGYSFASGDRATASGQKSFSFGTLTNASGSYSFAMGAWANAAGAYSVSMGQSNNAFADYSGGFGSGNNLADTANYSFALGFNNQIHGQYSFAAGFINTIDGDFASSFGRLNQSGGKGSISWGESNIASGDYSTTGGYDTEANANYSSAFGYKTIASGNNSAAFGNTTSATGASSFTFGEYCTASGSPSVAMGSSNTASGGRSLVTGHGNTASGWCSVAGGMVSTATGDFSTVLGHFNTAQAGWSLYIGRYAVTEGSTSTWVNTEPLLVAGNGSSDASRNNALTLYKDGNLDIDGDFTVGNGILFTDPENSNAVVEFKASDAVYADAGVSLRTLTNPADGSSILRVLSSGGSERLRVEHNGALSTSNYLEVEGTGISYILGNLAIGQTAANVALDVNGSIEYTGTITDVSDIRMKENIEPISGALDKISGISGFSYNLIGSHEREYGVSAQDIARVLPEAVSVVDPVKGTLGVSYIELIPVLIEAVKELQKENEELRKLIEN